MNSEQIRYAMESRASVDPDEITKDELRAAGCLNRVCVVLDNFNERVSYLGGVLVQMLCGAKNYDYRLRSTVGKLCQSLSYILNSSSWKDGELYDFDLDELRRKLRSFGVFDNQCFSEVKPDE